ASAHEFDDAERTHQVDERLDLLFLARDFDHYFLGGDIDDTATEDFGKFADLGSLPGFHLDFDQHEVALDMVARADIVDANHGDDLFKLFSNLFQHAIVADDDERHP